MGGGVIWLTYDLLIQALRLPEDAKIIQVWDGRDSADASSDSVRLTVCHPDLPEVAEGAATPSYDPKYGSELVDGEHYEPRFLGWGNGYYPFRLVRRDESLEQAQAKFRKALNTE